MRDRIRKIETSDQLIQNTLCIPDRILLSIMISLAVCLPNIIHIGKKDIVNDDDHLTGITLAQSSDTFHLSDTRTSVTDSFNEEYIAF